MDNRQVDNRTEGYPMETRAKDNVEYGSCPEPNERVGPINAGSRETLLSTDEKCFKKFSGFIKFNWLTWFLITVFGIVLPLFLVRLVFVRIFAVDMEDDFFQ